MREIEGIIAGTTDSKSLSTQTKAPISDRDLLKRYAETKSDAAFTEIRRRYARLVYSACLRESGDATLAEDAAQGVFLLLSRKAAGLVSHDSLAGWLFLASRYITRNLMKQDRRRQMNEAQAAQHRPSGSQSNPLWDAIEPLLHEALDALKPDDREAILLRYYQEETLAEIGARFRASENTVRMRINRGLERVRLHLSRAGVVVSLAMLALFLEERAAHAAPLQTDMPTLRNQSAPRQAIERSVRQYEAMASRRRLLRWMPAAASALLIVAVVGYRRAAADRQSNAARARFFRTIQGDWAGQLEFADDRSRDLFRYPTTVSIEADTAGDVIQWTAQYRGSSSVDITRITRSRSDGRFTAVNGGPQSSHSLNCAGSLTQVAPLQFTFTGRDAAGGRLRRLQFSVVNDMLTIREEYRVGDSSPFLFRNQFLLRRK